MGVPRKIGILFLIPLLSVQAAFSGCSPQKITGESSSVSVYEDQGRTVDKKGGDSNNMGVINYTVVDVFRDSDVKSERVTQALLNQPVNILEEQESWLKVNVLDGYTGWIKSKYIDRDCSSINESDYMYKVIVTAKEKTIYTEAKGGFTLSSALMGSEFYSRNKAEGRYEIALPGARKGWVDEGGCIQVPIGSKLKKTSTADFIMTARKLKGAVYLWGGISAWGIDCSGFTYISSKVNGVDLPRDADQQFTSGEAVNGIADALPGDLLFFSTDSSLKDISHVGIYLGDGQFIHASKTKGSVVTSGVNEDYYKIRLIGIRRIF